MLSAGYNKINKIFACFITLAEVYPELFFLTQIILMIKYLKTICFVTALFVTVTGICQTADEKAVYECFNKQAEVWNKGDIEAYVDLYTPGDSARMILKEKVLYGKDSILAFYKKYWPKERMGKLSFSKIEMEQIAPDYIFVTGIFTVVFNDGKRVSGRFSSLSKKVNGKWYIYTDHSG